MMPTLVWGGMLQFLCRPVLVNSRWSNAPDVYRSCEPFSLGTFPVSANGLGEADLKGTDDRAELARREKPWPERP